MNFYYNSGGGVVIGLKNKIRKLEGLIIKFVNNKPFTKEEEKFLEEFEWKY